jgi:hypothetical protein
LATLTSISRHSSLLHFSQTVDVSFPPIFEDKEDEKYSLSDEEDSVEEGVDRDAWFEPENCLSSSCLTMTQRVQAGFLVVTQLEVRIAINVAYIHEFDEPPTEEWLNIVSILNARLGVSQNTIRRIFKRCCDGEPSPETVQAGRGRHRKLARNNPGIKAGAAALNNLVPPVMASFICNAVNEKKFPGNETKQVCRNTRIGT